MRLVELAIAVAVMAGCAAQGPTDSPSPAGSASPTARPRPTELCAAIGQLQEDIGDFRQLRFRSGNAGLMALRHASIEFSYEAVADLAPPGRAALVNALGDAVTTLGLAVEDYRTTDRLSAAEAYVRRSTDALARATRALKNAVRCGVRPRSS
jgi:hypothetical protein